MLEALYGEMMMKQLKPWTSFPWETHLFTSMDKWEVGLHFYVFILMDVKKFQCDLKEVIPHVTAMRCFPLYVI